MAKEEVAGFLSYWTLRKAGRFEGFRIRYFGGFLAFRILSGFKGSVRGFSIFCSQFLCQIPHMLCR